MRSYVKYITRHADEQVRHLYITKSLPQRCRQAKSEVKTAVIIPPERSWGGWIEIPAARLPPSPRLRQRP